MEGRRGKKILRGGGGGGEGGGRGGRGGGVGGRGSGGGRGSRGGGDRDKVLVAVLVKEGGQVKWEGQRTKCVL